MKAIFLFVAGLCLVNQTMAQCSGSISGGYSEICVGTTTGTMTVSGVGTIDNWEYSFNGGGWTYANGATNTHSDFPISTGTYIYRVKITGGGTTCYSSTKTIEVKNASGGTIASGGGAVCSGGSATALSLTGAFTGPGGALDWEYSTNGGSTYTLDGLGYNNNPYTPSLSLLGGTGTYIFRAKASCGISSTAYSSNTKTYQVNNPTEAAVCNDADDLRKAVAKVSISGIPYSFSGFLVNHTAQDGRLLFLTSSHPFTSNSPSSGALSSATFTWNEDLSTCGGSAATAVTSTGCTILVTDGFLTLLELKAAPDLPQLYYLGWDLGATGNYNSIFQSAGSIKKGKVSASGSPSDVTGSFSGDDFNESSGSGVYKFTSWSSGNTEKRGRGAPLLAGSTGKKARGVYIGGGEVNCGNGPSYFAYLNSGQTALLAYLRDGSETNTATARMNYCKPSEVLNFAQIESWTYQVTGSIVSTQNISDGITVKYQAGSYVELNDGFYSGTDFVAEINPCIITRTTIAAKTDDIDLYEGNYEAVSDSYTSKIIIYPTVLPSGRGINIVASENLTNVDVVVYDLNGKPVFSNKFAELQQNVPIQTSLPSLASGFYLVAIQSSTLSLTQKIIIQ